MVLFDQPKIFLPKAEEDMQTEKIA